MEGDLLNKQSVHCASHCSPTCGKLLVCAVHCFGAAGCPHVQGFLALTLLVCK